MTANPLSTMPPMGPTSGMAPPPGSGRFKPIDPLRLLRRYWLLLLVTALIGVGLGVGLYLYLKENRPRYTSSAALQVDLAVVQEPTQVTIGSNMQSNVDVEAFISNEINLINSESIIREALGRPVARETQWLQSFGNDLSAAREQMQQEMLSASMPRGSTLIRLNMEAERKEDAQKLLEAVIDSYLTTKQLAAQQQGTNLRRLLISMRDRADADVGRLRDAMERFIAFNELEALKVDASDEQRIYDSLWTQSLDLDAALVASRGTYEALQKSASATEMSDEEWAQIKLQPSVAARREQLMQLDEQRRAIIAGGKLPGHPQVQQLDRQRDSVQLELDRAIDEELGELRAVNLQMAARQVESLLGQTEALRPKLAESSQNLQELQQKLAEYAELEADLAFAMDSRTEANNALQRQSALQDREEAVQVKRQVAPTDAELTSPTVMLVPMVAFLLTGLVGGLLTLREMLDQRIRSPMDVKLLPEATLLGLIPAAKEDPTGNGQAERTVELAPTGLLAESYRQVRTALLARMDRRGYKTLICVGAMPQAGTSTVVHNLATSLAFNGRRVLVVDANFRRPSQHRLMDVLNDRGLVDVLRDRAALDDVVQAHGDTTLAVLPTGPAEDEPPELLEGAAFRKLLGDLEAEYDLILIDAPPALLTSDSQLLSKHADAIAVVVKADADKRGMVGRMLRQLDGQRADVLGVILNGVQSSAGGYFRQSYEEFYRYRQSEKPGRGKRRGNGRSTGGRPANGRPSDRAAALAEAADVEPGDR